MKVLIIDNEVALRSSLKKMLQLLLNEEISISEAGGVVEGLEKINTVVPDIVFLDIEMDDGTGFDLLKQVVQPKFQLIFTTAHYQYAIEAFKFSAIDYLLKPISPTALQESIERAKRNLKSNDLKAQLEVLMQQVTHKNEHDKKIVLRDSESMYFIKVADILFCEAEGPYTKFYFANLTPITISKNLKEFEQLLEPLGFIRTHHSYLANPDKITLYDKTDGGALILEGGQSIPVSQRKKDMVLQYLENRL
jgi:two-component system, LytTR family, response regulator